MDSPAYSVSSNSSEAIDASSILTPVSTHSTAGRLPYIQKSSSSSRQQADYERTSSPLQNDYRQGTSGRNTHGESLGKFNEDDENNLVEQASPISHSKKYEEESNIGKDLKMYTGRKRRTNKGSEIALKQESDRLLDKDWKDGTVKTLLHTHTHTLSLSLSLSLSLYIYI